MKVPFKSLSIVLVVVVLAALAVPAFAADSPGQFVGPDAIFYEESNSVSIWTPDEGGFWNPAITLSADEIAKYAETPEEHTLVASLSDVSLYKLNTGEWQINNGPDAEGKVDVVVLNADFSYSHQYQYDRSGLIFEWPSWN